MLQYTIIRSTRLNYICVVKAKLHLISHIFTKKTHLCTSLTYVDTCMFNFWHMWTCLSGKFAFFAHCERTMMCVHCKTTCVYMTFRITKTCICVTINITLCFPPTFPSIYLNSHTTTWLFYLQILFNIPLLTYETKSEYIGSTGAKDC